LGNGTFDVRYAVPSSEQEGKSVYYGFVDEERKININTVPNDTLKYFFETVAEVSSQEAGDIADSIIDWRDEDDDLTGNGAENGYYKTLDPLYSCKNKNFDVLEELLLVKGISQDIFDNIRDYATIFGEGAVNINTADREVLQSLKMNEALVEKIVHYRAGSDGIQRSEDDQVFSEAASIESVLNSAEGLSSEETATLEALLEKDLLAVKSDYFRGNVYGKLNNNDKSKKVVFVINRNEQIRYWKE